MVDIPLIVKADSSSLRKSTGDLIDFKQALGGVRQEQAQGTRAGQAYTAQMGAGSRATAAFSAQLAKLRGPLVFATIAASALAAAKAIAIAGDAATQAENRLNALGLNGRDTYDRLAASATRLGVETKSVIDTFARFALVRDEIGLTSDQVRTLTENVIGLGLQSGASVQEVTSASVQLAQALASGVLQGDELRSILETMPALAKAIADGLGVSVGQLRQLGSEGKLVAADIAAALTNLNVDPSGFDSIAQANVRIANELDRVLVNLDRALNLSGLWKTVLNAVADGLGLVADGVEAATREVSDLSDKAKAGIAGMKEAWDNATDMGAARGNLAQIQQELQQITFYLGEVRDGTITIDRAIESLNSQGFLDVGRSVDDLRARLVALIPMLGAAINLVASLEKRQAALSALPLSATQFAPGPPGHAEVQSIIAATPRYVTPSVDVPGTGTGSAGGGGGGSTRDAYSEQQVELVQRLRDAEKERAAILGGEDMDRWRAVQDALNAATAEGVTLTEEQTAAITEQASAVFDLEKSVEGLREAFEAIEQAAASFGTELGRALGDAVFGIGNFRDAAKAAFEDLTRSILEELGKLAAQKLLMMLLGGGAGGGFSLNLGIPGFASGGDHRGGLRVVGERGPELEATGASRIHSTSDLKSMMKPQTNIVINNNAPGVTAEARERKDGTIEVVIEAARQAITSDIQRGTGSVGRALENVYGVRRLGR
jgi:tape measure domain-containing protein